MQLKNYHKPSDVEGSEFFFYYFGFEWNHVRLMTVFWWVWSFSYGLKKKCVNRFKMLSWGRDVFSWCSSVLITAALILIPIRGFLSTAQFHLAENQLRCFHENSNSDTSHLSACSRSVIQLWKNEIFWKKRENISEVYFSENPQVCMYDPLLRIKAACKQMSFNS